MKPVEWGRLLENLPAKNPTCRFTKASPGDATDLEHIRQYYGGMAGVARASGRSDASFSKWGVEKRGVPLEWAFFFEHATEGALTVSMETIKGRYDPFK